MHEFLRSLYDDHQHILKLLDVFEREVGVFENAGRPDYDILETAIEYCAQYLDAVHHRKEEQMLQQLAERDAAAAEQAQALTGQHHDLEHLTHEVSHAFAAVRDDAFASRESLVKPARKWLQAYRDHLHWEEAQLFTVAEQKLTDADWDAAHAKWEHVVNPLHDKARDERFNQLANILLHVSEP